MDPFCYLRFVFVSQTVLSVSYLLEEGCLLALLYVMFSCVVFHFPKRCLGSGKVFDCINF